MVQGVFFRVATRQEAVRLGLTGKVCNLPDGRVEVQAQGDDEAVRALCDWLRRGPRLARVDDVSCEEMPPQEFAGFSIR
ncbi:MAG: acylphosphatase [Gammaproteobacteria bacterium]|nr:MAG: acylphosphatase [Gammaproteobacteria bacterium]